MTKKEPLGGGRFVTVSEAHHFGTDAFLLASFTSLRPGERACDLGTGCGIIPALWTAGRASGGQGILGIDISEAACKLARATSEDCGGFDVINCDMRALPEQFPSLRESFHTVACNPPYFRPGSGYIAPGRERAGARAELSCDIADVCAAARFLLRYGGQLCICFRPERLCDLLCAMREADIEPKRIRFVQNMAGDAPWLVLVEGRRGGRPHLTFLPPMIMRHSDGTLTEEAVGLYIRIGNKDKSFE